MRQIRVVIADTQPVFAEGLRKLLRNSRSIQVIDTASDAGSLGKLASEASPDVIVMNAALNLSSATEVSKEIRRCCPAASFLYLFDQTPEPGIVLSALQAGIKGFLSKQRSSQEMKCSILAVSSGQEVMDEEIARRLFHSLTSDSSVPLISSAPRILSQRELEVLILAGRGKSNKEIAQELSITPRCVHAHLNRTFKKLQVGSRTEAVVYGLARGWFTIRELSSGGPVVRRQLQ